MSNPKSVGDAAPFKEHDCVKLTGKFNGLPAGTEGTIVHLYNENHFAVEFPECQVMNVPINKLEITEPSTQS